MLPVPHPEALSVDWTPPAIVGRGRPVGEAVRILDPPVPRAPPPWSVQIRGPPGAGTSTVARQVLRAVADVVRCAQEGGSVRGAAVRTRFCRGAHGVAAALLQNVDEGFSGRGFSVAEILAGFLRRVRREGRPTVVLLDDLDTGGPEVAPILRALGDPDRFLPEGEVGLPPVWTILAGTPEGLTTALRGALDRFRRPLAVDLPPYSLEELTRLVADRAARALGRASPEDLAPRIAERARAEGHGASRAMELLRRELLGHRGAARRPEVGRGAARPVVPVEAHLIRAFERAVPVGGVTLGEVKRWEELYARTDGARPLATTTFWRRVVRLEQAGYVRRDVRPGGVGGTRSILRVLTPVDEWITAEDRPRSRPTAADRPVSDGGASGEARLPSSAPASPRAWAGAPG